MDEIELHVIHYHHSPKQKEETPRIISEHHTHSHEKLTHLTIALVGTTTLKMSTVGVRCIRPSRVEFLNAARLNEENFVNIKHPELH